ncbi:MAG: lytic transglycosylase, partial [Betaproteobacteria bacterium HGW-Betaproteobacteria-13]
MRTATQLLTASVLLLCTVPGFAGTSGAGGDAPAWTDEPPVLARMLEDGYRAERNRLPQLAADRYCAAARYGSTEAQFQLGRLLLKHRRMADQPDNAMNLLALAARQGHEAAQTLLASGRNAVADIGNDLPDCLYSGETGSLADTGAAVPHEVVERFVASLSIERRRHARLVQRLAPGYDVDPRLALAIVRTESNFNANARSPRNAQGLMQLIPDTAERFGVRNIMDPEQN